MLVRNTVQRKTGFHYGGSLFFVVGEGISKGLTTTSFDARTAHLDFVELRAALYVF